MTTPSTTIAEMPAVIPSPNQIPLFEELVAAPAGRKPRHLRLQPPLLADLTRAQRRAVTHGSGPLLVVAGAGTGKTTVLTRRIAWLIAEQRAKPSEILALTFTERAAAEMQERVDRLVPYGFTDSVISTFHAFGDRLLRTHALEAGLSDRVTVLSRAEQIVFLRDHLFELPLDRFRPLGDPTRFLAGMAALFSRARDEDIGPEQYQAAAEQLAIDAAAAPDDGALAEQAARQAELAAVFIAYDRLMRASDRIDFGDQVSLALNLLRAHPAVLAAERERYRYLLVDEFQDTNRAQFELVQLLAPGSDANVTVVGDDDQSIYRFRGAALSNILGFSAAYPGTGRVVLTENFRSNQAILDAAYRLVTHNNPERLEVREGVDKRLVARGRRSGTSDPAAVGVVALATGSDEADEVAHRIRTAVRAGARPGDHAILVRGNRDADPYLRALSQDGLAWRFSGSAGLYAQPEVRLLFNFLRAVNDPTDSVSVFDVATSELFGLPASEVTILLNRAGRRRIPLESALRAAVADGPAAGLSAAARDQAGRLLDSLDVHRRLAADHPGGEVLYRFVTGSGWLARLAFQARESGPERLENVARFFDLLHHQGSILRDSRLPFLVGQLETLLAAGDDPPTSDAEPDEGNAVHVLTYHKAKGLEFPVVFMVGLVEDRFPTRRRSEPLSLPDSLVGEVPAAEVHLAEERRLFYVGMTRAQDRLVLSWARDDGHRPRRLSQFVGEAVDLVPATPTELLRPSEVERIERLRPPVAAPRSAAAPPDPDRSLTLSYGQVSTYLDCPARYWYEHQVRIPTPVGHQMVVGRALHDAVQFAHRAQMDGRQVTVDELHVRLDASWESEGFLTRAHEDARRQSAHVALDRFWNEQQAEPASPIGVEQDFAFRLGRDRIRGRMDLVEQADGRVRITDYKSSDVRDPATANRRARESLQLGIYALAWESLHGAPPDELALHFLDSGIVGRASASPDRLARASEQVARAADGIRASEFAASPSTMRCGSCPFREICPDAAR